MDEQTELLRQILEQLRGAGLPGGSTVDEARQALEDFSDKIKLANLSADQLKARSEKLIRDQAVRERELQNAIKAKLITEKEAAAELKKYIEEQKHIQQILESLGEVYEINIEQLSAYHDTIKDVIRTEEERKKAIQQSKEKLGKFDENIKALTDHALKPLFNATTGVLKGLQSGASGVRVAGDAALGLASAATGAGSALGEQAQNFGLSIAATTRGPLRLFGLGLTGIGTALGLTSKAAGAVAEAALPYLTNELEKTQKLFETANNAGALFANGMTGMRVAAHGAGLTIDQFDEVLKSQSKNFALMGVGVSDATKRLGGITQSLQSSGLQRQLMNLGYGFREQAELVGETIELMRLAQGGAAKIPNDVVAKETAKYAENLRLISAITGEDAKAKMQQAKEAANNMAFQQKLASMSAEQQIQIQAAMNSMTQLERKNFMDMMLFGTVINTDGAKSLALFPALQEKLNEQVNLANQGLLDGKTNIDLNAKYANTLKEQYLSSTAAAQAAFAGADSVAGVMQHALEGLDQSLKFTTESVNNAGKAVQEQKNTQDDLTNRMRELSENTQKFQIQIESLLTSKVISKYADVLQQGMNVILDTIRKFAGMETSGGAGAIGGKGIMSDISGAIAGGIAAASAGAKMLWDKAKSGASAVGEGVTKAGSGLVKKIGLGAAAPAADVVMGIWEEAQVDEAEKKGLITPEEADAKRKAIRSGAAGATVGGVLGTAAGAFTGPAAPVMIPLLSTAGSVLGGAVGKRLSNQTGPAASAETIPSAALGGILSGPISGFLANLHGTEAVVPLPDGKTIPVDIPAMDNMLAALSDMKTALSASLTAQTAKTVPSTNTNQSLVDALNNHADLMREQMKKISELIRVAEEQRDISRNILQTSL